MPDPTEIEVPQEVVIASLKAQLAEKCHEVAIAHALAQKFAQEKTAVTHALVDAEARLAEASKAPARKRTAAKKTNARRKS